MDHEGLQRTIALVEGVRDNLRKAYVDCAAIDDVRPRRDAMKTAQAACIDALRAAGVTARETVHHWTVAGWGIRSTATGGLLAALGNWLLAVTARLRRWQGGGQSKVGSVER